MASLAQRNLFHDKVRFGVTLTGIVFSVILTSIQLGLFEGFSVATADIIAHSRADLWITSKDLTHIENGVPFSERKLYQILAIPKLRVPRSRSFSSATGSGPTVRWKAYCLSASILTENLVAHGILQLAKLQT